MISTKPPPPPFLSAKISAQQLRLREQIGLNRNYEKLLVPWQEDLIAYCRSKINDAPNAQEDLTFRLGRI